MPYVTARGIRLYYEEHGSGSTLIVLHGLLGSVASAALRGLSTRELAAKGLHGIAFDARGHGRSGFSVRKEDYSWPSLVADLRGVLDALGIQRASLCGSSMGAATALMFALEQPERVECLVLRSFPPFALDLPGVRWKLDALALLYECLGVRVSSAILAPFVGKSGLAEQLGAQRRAAVVPAIRGLLLAAPRLPEKCGPGSGIAAYPTRQFPALLLAHPGDALHPLRSAEMLRDRLPRATLHVAPSAAYFREHPDELTETVATFVRGDVSTSAASGSSDQLLR